jgi:hypothetical protein
LSAKINRNLGVLAPAAFLAAKEETRLASNSAVIRLATRPVPIAIEQLGAMAGRPAQG